ncbi:hypothetical protein F5Y06DRAFT_182313 [Hypoxylon sp. FL0890]|nr:hypothetical protein F5Y06DRAFT_182313 [Hypoxylon sp. FL0890]
MASFFQSFRNSSMPKRLLRYTLSKLDYFDTDALDIDNLDFAMGVNNVFTLQDVGVKLQKLEQLLQLPPSFEVRKAKVLLLRISVPSAFYTSPITVEVDGVEIKLKLTSKDDSSVIASRGTAHGKRRPGSSEEGDPVPHAIDLAQSFLETQPLKEKADLQAALEAETQDLGASVTSSEDGSDEDYPLGTGQPLSLPTFLADFLQGILDRVQVSIKGVTFHLDVEVPVEPNSTVSELVTFQLAIDEVNVEGVTTAVDENTSDGASKAIHKEGKRHVGLHKIRASLISEANVFSNLARSPSIPSSFTTNSPTITRQQTASDEPIPPAMPASEWHSNTDDLAQSRYHPHLMDSEDAFNIPYDLSGSNEEQDEDSRSAPSTPRALAPQLAPQDEPDPAPFLHTARSTINTPPQPWSSLTRIAQSEPALEHEQRWGESSIESSQSTEDRPLGSVVSDGAHSLSEDLARSHLFSHEEAESMYMSAFSHAASSQVSQGGPAMPGAWDSGPSSAENSPNSKREHRSPLSNSPEPTTIKSQEPPSNIRASSLNEDSSHKLEHSSIVDNLEEATQSHDDLHNPDKEGSSAEEAATPRGPTRLVKELVSLSAISLYIPSNHQRIQVAYAGEEPASGHHRAHLGRSVSPNLPGAFSVYMGEQSTASIAPAASTLKHETASDKTLEVIISTLEIRSDLSSGFLLAMGVSRILSALKERPQAPPAKQKGKVENKSAQPPIPDIKIVAEQITVHFLENLVGIADTPERLFNPNPASLNAEALLTASIQNLNVGLSGSSSSTETSVDVGKFRLGYGNDDIVSFDQRIQMRASVRDAFPAAGADISLKLSQTLATTRCEVTTLPLHIKMDLQRLDETFSWFGGLSGFLNMSSSMTSNTSPTPQSPTRTPPKPRGVRFDAPIRPDDTSANSENKVNMRLGGFRLDLIGKECSVALDTSAVKLVSREEGIGIGISKIQLAGPYMRRSKGDPPINAVITNTRLEYLMTPKDNDLERLLELIIPSKHKFSQNDNEIMVDTLLRQRRKGAVLRVNVDGLEVGIGKLQHLQVLPALGEEIAKLSTVAKYLPEDDRPGILTLALVRNLDVTVDVDRKFGSIRASLKDAEVGHITIPSLLALGVGSISIRRNHTEELVGTANSSLENVGQGPVLTMRMIGDEMDPVIKIRMRNLNIEYRVPTIMDILGLAEDTTPQDFEATLAASVANLGEHAHAALTGKPQSRSPMPNEGKGGDSKPTKVDFVFQDCLLGLNPLGLTSKMVIVLTDAHFEIVLSSGDDAKALGHLNRASILLIDDVSILESKESSSTSRRRSSNTPTPQVVELCQRGYVDICFISSARITIQVGANQIDGNKWIDVELRDDLLVLETCADSTQTLIGLANALAPPTPPSKEIKYRTNIVPVEDMLASISGDAFGKAEGDYDFDKDFGTAEEELGGDNDSDFDFGSSGQSSPLAVDSNYYAQPSVEAQLFDATDSMVSERTTTQDTTDGVLLTNFDSQPDIRDDDEELVIHENYFGSGSVIQGTAHRWNSAKNEYDVSNDAKVQRSPLSVRVRDVHFIWNLFDGYDWDRTREVISKAVYDIEVTAVERQSRHDRARASTDMELVEEETVIGDFLFNSIYIGIPANRDPRELAQAINQELNDAATETESIATTAMTVTQSRQGNAYRSRKKLKLNRSKRHKVTFELKGVNVDMVTFPPDSGETQSSIDVRVKDLDIFDHVPTSTWKKFATYDQDAGEREMGSSMVHLEILNVKPVPELAASEIVLKATVLPLRLHVDQDALDFITRFFEFKDESAPIHASPSDVPFIQRAEVNDIPVNLDFKPKRVDYAGLRSGHTTEFMNFLVLDQSRMILKHTIIYGVLGFDRLGKTLNDIWMPDVKKTQLPGVLAGLAPVRSLVNVGSGFRNLVEIPIKEYKKDGRIIRSISKGAVAFAKTTGTEIVKLGAKLAVGTQYALQGAEGVLVKQPDHREIAGWDDEELDTEEPKQISLYADQPTGVMQGLRGAYSSLARDLNVARDAIIAVPGEVMESQSAQGAAKAVLKRAPTIIFRPLIGSSKAIGQTLMGATNALDPQNQRRVEQKYKRY